MNFNPNKIRNMRDEINGISGIIDNYATPTEQNRCNFLFTEMNTLMNVMNLNEQKGYKECFILLRTVLEKFLFFWLMFKGRKYRWTVTFHIIPNISKTITEARNKTLELWKNEMKSGNPYLKSVIDIQAGKKVDNIIVTYEGEGMFVEENGHQTGIAIPIYNLILESEIKHITDPSISEGETPKSLKQLQNNMYHHFVYIKGILKNLTMNNLITKAQLNQINIHYNFLSNYVHPTIANRRMWENLNFLSTQLHQDALKELIWLYIAKFMYLYVEVFVSSYKTTSNQSYCHKCEIIMNELRSLSKDLWFLNDDPTQFDIDQSNQRKMYLRARKHMTPADIIYYENPLERLQKMRSSCFRSG
jgi:hypothetical protein